MNNESVISQMKSVATALIPKGGSAILYGSRARGDAKTNSDWDILILLDKDKLVQEDYEKISYPFVLLGCDLGEEINPITLKRNGNHIMSPLSTRTYNETA